MRVADTPGSSTPPPDVAAEGALEQYAALIEATDGAIILRSLDGTILGWDAAAERIYGFSESEALGQPLSLIVPADRARETLECLRSVASGGRVEPFKTVRVRRDKTRIDVTVTLSGVRDRQDHIVGAMSVARDISASTSIERSLGASRAALSDANVFLEKAERLGQTSTWILHLGAEWSMTCSPESHRVLGILPETPITVELFFSLVHPDDRDRVEAAMAVALRDHRSYEIEYRLVCPDGVTRWVHAWAEPEYDDDGEPARVLGVVQDITERHAAEDQLRASERRFRLIAENAHDLIFRITMLPEPRFEYVSPAAFAITGYTADEIYALPALATTLVTREHVLRLESLFNSGELSKPIDIEIRRKDGSTTWVSQQLTLISDDTGALIAVEGIDRDITERKRADDERAYANSHDTLTGLRNRSLLRDHLELSRCRTRAEGHRVFVVSLDLDDFTLINDSYGYDTGDAVLVAIADVLTTAATDEAIVGRTGADEFMVVGDDGDGDGATAFVERVRSSLRRSIRCNAVDLHLHVRMGVAVDGPHESSVNLLRDADIALARAKQRRTDTGVEFFDANTRTNANERLALVTDLYLALDRGEFELLYQPILRLADDRIIGAEALIRWNHPQRGVVNPTEFIPLAEDTGLIVGIGAWALDEACTQLRSWSDDDAALVQLGVSVNLSVKQLQSPDIVDTVTRTLRRTGITPGRLTVEMTESVFADDLETIQHVLDKLRLLGVRAAIDDFGTGYSSFAYLKCLPIDTLKIDKTFVDGLGTDPRDDAIIASTLTVAKAMRLFTVAEGVETSAQLAALRAMGCRAAQGFYVSKPVTGVEFASIATRPADASAGDVETNRDASGTPASDSFAPNSPLTNNESGSFGSVPPAVLDATRSLLWIVSGRDARRITEGLVRDLGGSVVPAGTDNADVIPADLSFGDGPPSLASAPLLSLARAWLDDYLPAFLLDARQVLELSGRTERLAESAATDVLTTLPNRRMIERALGRLAAPDTVIMMDLDHFKRINDELGHAAGDDVLRSFGQVLRATIRGRDFVGRFGGEEFVVILDRPEGADVYLERLRNEWVGERPFPVSFSAGIASFVGDADQTMSMADEALYRAKDSGRDRWLWATPQPANEPQQPRDHVEDYLEDAISGQRQPAIRLTLDLLDHRVPPGAIVEDLLGAAQKEIGERWYRNELTAADEHVATGVATAALDALAGETPERSSDDLIVVACAEGDWHSLAAQMFGESLRAQGVNVTVLGASTPAEAVAEFLVRSACRALAISCSVPTFLGGAVRLIDTAHRHGIPVIVGGRAFGNDSLRATHLGADAWASTAGEAAVILANWRVNPPSVTGDPAPLDPVAVLLNAQADRLGDAAMERMITDFPPLAGFDDRQLARTREDLVFIVEFLAAAILADAPDIFAEFLDWLQALLVNRGAPPHSLISGLDALKPAIEAIDPAASHFIDAGRDQLLAGIERRPRPTTDLTRTERPCPTTA